MAADIQGRLTAKVGPLPVWAWAVVIVGAYLLYARFHTAAAGSAAPSGDTAAQTTGSLPSGDGSGASGGAGAGSAADNMTQGSWDALASSLGQISGSLDSLSYYLYTTPAYRDPNGAGQAGGGGTGSGGPAGGGGTTTTTTTSPGEVYIGTATGPEGIHLPSGFVPPQGWAPNQGGLPDFSLSAVTATPPAPASPQVVAKLTGRNQPV